LNLRGADRSGADYYHAGLTDDLEAALRSTALRSYDDVLLLGYSLGGNMMLRYLADRPDPRVRAAAAVCSPIDLQTSARIIDRPRGAFYRRHVLRALKEIYEKVAARREVPIPVSEAERIDTIEGWDERVIAPRHGFSGAEDYWAKTSACTVLDEIRVPTLFVAAERDPMVRIDTVRPWLERTSAVTGIIVREGGHVGFPRNANLGLPLAGSVEEQVVAWLRDPV
jgi:predicted alpha/beta-fold hydrolase